MLVAAPLRVVAQGADALGEDRVVGGHRAAFAGRAEVLAGVEPEAAEASHRAGAAAAVVGAVRLRRVFDDRDAVAVGDREDGVHRRRLAVEMDRQDRLGARRDRRLESSRVEGAPPQVDVDEDRPRADVADRPGGGDEGHRHRDHLVAGTDVEGVEGEVERARAAVDGDRVRAAAVRREVAFEALDPGAEDEGRVVEHAGELVQQLGAQALDLGLEVDEGDAHGDGILRQAVTARAGRAGGRRRHPGRGERPAQRSGRSQRRHQSPSTRSTCAPSRPMAKRSTASVGKKCTWVSMV